MKTELREIAKKYKHGVTPAEHPFDGISFFNSIIVDRFQLENGFWIELSIERRFLDGPGNLCGVMVKTSNGERCDLSACFYNVDQVEQHIKKITDLKVERRKIG